jgi:signal transduction histidine kinase
MTQSLKTALQVLVIDDEATTRQGCLRALAPANYAVDTAPDLQTGRQLMESQAYDLFILDVMLPDGNGLDLLDTILEEMPSAICIIITGAASTEMAVEAVRRGAYDFVSKPFTCDELLMAVSKSLERHRLLAIEAEAQALAEAKAHLEELDEAKTQLMLKLAHEMRAPVSAAQSYVNLLQGGLVEEEEVQPALDRIHSRLQEALDLVADLLELAHLKQTQGGPGQQAEPVDMAESLAKTVDMLRPQSLAKDQRLEIEVGDRPVIWANPDHMKQIWTNLLTNAIKYTPRGGHITARLHGNGDNLTGVVEDTGIGIAPEDMELLFQDFFRTDEAKASGEIGTGLGLSIVKQIVDGYNGWITVSSTPDQGTRFIFHLPLQSSSSEREP